MLCAQHYEIDPILSKNTHRYYSLVSAYSFGILAKDYYLNRQRTDYILSSRFGLMVVFVLTVFDIFGLLDSAFRTSPDFKSSQMEGFFTHYARQAYFLQFCINFFEFSCFHVCVFVLFHANSSKGLGFLDPMLLPFSGLAAGT